MYRASPKIELDHTIKVVNPCQVSCGYAIVIPVPHFRTLTEISYELAQRLPPLITQQGPILFLADNEKEARKLIELCQYWNSNFPARTIISPYTQEQHHLSAKEFDAQILCLRRGEQLSISALTKRLLALGLEREPRAVSAGTFAIRGDVVDIMDYQPVRLEYNNDTIEKVLAFNPFTQHSAGSIPQLLLWPQAYAPHIPLWHEQDLIYEFITNIFISCPGKIFNYAYFLCGYTCTVLIYNLAVFYVWIFV